MYQPHPTPLINAGPCPYYSWRYRMSAYCQLRIEAQKQRDGRFLVALVKKDYYLATATWFCNQSVLCVVSLCKVGREGLFTQPSYRTHHIEAGKSLTFPMNTNVKGDSWLWRTGDYLSWKFTYSAAKTFEFWLALTKTKKSKKIRKESKNSLSKYFLM